MKKEKSDNCGFEFCFSLALSNFFCLCVVPEANAIETSNQLFNISVNEVGSYLLKKITKRLDFFPRSRIFFDSIQKHTKQKRSPREDLLFFNNRIFLCVGGG